MKFDTISLDMIERLNDCLNNLQPLSPEDRQELVQSLIKTRFYFFPEAVTSVYVVLHDGNCKLLLPVIHETQHEIPLHDKILRDHKVDPDADVIRGFVVITTAKERLLIADVAKREVGDTIQHIMPALIQYGIYTAYLHSDLHPPTQNPYRNSFSYQGKAISLAVGKFTDVFDTLRGELVERTRRRPNLPLTNTEWMRNRLRP